ncbi:MAG: D-alanine-D-alanine ligase and related ATP-grasp enzymes-like [Firmicutes bacterium]|nr:D-alanine-D-alanine ligase and related ATP-grasp enzymes-like [Bacillota bacterium]MDI6706187.1 ATP-grasp domain-containing protein [Bacillota bacterium]
MGCRNKLRVGLTYNLKSDVLTLNEDDQAEFDDLDTVNDIKRALESAGCIVYPMEATGSIINTIQSERIDIVFNFAEGLKGRGREAQIPALLNMLSIPFTGSDETTLAVALDKALAKKVIAHENIKTANFQVFFSKNDRLKKGMKYPLIVKPNAEGSSKGIIDTSIANNNQELYSLVERIVVHYNQPALVEEYIDGREFTVGILGNGDNIEILPIMEINFNKENGKGFYSYRVKKHSIDLLSYTCPALLTPDEERMIKKFAKKVYSALQCNDVARIDLRLSKADNKPYFIEINPLPGLADGFSDLTLIIRAAGMKYDDLIIRILNEALKRYGMDTI